MAITTSTDLLNSAVNTLTGAFDIMPQHWADRRSKQFVQQLLRKYHVTTMSRTMLTAERKAEYFLLGATFTTEVILDQEYQLMLYKNRLCILDPEY